MSESAPKKIGVSLPVLVLSLLLAVTTTAAITLALRPVALGADGLTSVARQPAAPPAEPITQHDTVTPRDHLSGQVYYPLPFTAKPKWI